MKTNRRFLFTAALGLALTFTLSCSSDSKDDDNSHSGGANGGNPGTGGGGVDYGADVPYEGGPYKTVVIGGKTWFQRNLNCNVSGSKCGNGSSLSESNTATCDTYGRLYDWATAMALPSKCNSKLSTTDADCAIGTPHKGICPTGWHIPSDAEWTALETAVGGSSTAGKYLKATNGWNSGWNSGGSGEDKFGFAALPGGSGNSGGYFNNVGNNGYWWSASEINANHAYERDMYDYNEYVVRYSSGKSDLYSVRCLQD